jgi:hypothetical protein
VPIWGTYQEGHPGSEAQLTQRNVWLAQEKANIAAYIRDFPVGTIKGPNRQNSTSFLKDGRGLQVRCGSTHAGMLQIGFVVPSNADRLPVSVQMFDMRGVRVATVVNQALSAGNHRFLVNIKQLTAGQYLVRVRESGYEMTVPVVVAE